MPGLCPWCHTAHTGSDNAESVGSLTYTLYSFPSRSSLPTPLPAPVHPPPSPLPLSTKREMDAEQVWLPSAPLQAGELMPQGSTQVQVVPAKIPAGLGARRDRAAMVPLSPPGHGRQSCACVRPWAHAGLRRAEAPASARLPLPSPQAQTCPALSATALGEHQQHYLQFYFPFSEADIFTKWLSFLFFLFPGNYFLCKVLPDCKPAFLNQEPLGFRHCAWKKGLKLPCGKVLQCSVA